MHDVKSNDKTLCIKSLFTYQKNKGLQTYIIPLQVQQVSVSQLSLRLKTVPVISYFSYCFIQFIYLFVVLSDVIHQSSQASAKMLLTVQPQSRKRVS